MRLTVENVGLLILALVFASAIVAGGIQGADNEPEPAGGDYPSQDQQRDVQTPYSKSWSSEQREALRNSVQRRINEYRQERELPTVDPSAGLRDTAKRHGEYLIRSGQTQHLGQGGSSPDDRVGSCYSGEVIASVHTKTDVTATARAAVRLFINSPPHREILLDDSHRQMGVGVGVSDNGELLKVVVDFCR